MLGNSASCAILQRPDATALVPHTPSGTMLPAKTKPPREGERETDHFLSNSSSIILSSHADDDGSSRKEK
uniref:Uncharacterized protein n=1 Tax=Anopheles dirus TaxID=7168 RepID=A0A182NYN9_9DIPT